MPVTNTFATSGSLAVDMRFGWRPANPYSGAPIPLYYDFANYDEDIDYFSKDPVKVPIFLGPRIPNSLQMHRLWSRQEFGVLSDAYPFKFPPRPAPIKSKRVEEPRPFLGMNPRLAEIFSKRGKVYDQNKELTFDSFFESGNLDLVQKATDDTYHMYMRTDTNTRGSHQWFYFSVEHTAQLSNKKVKFVILNFTKADSLYTPGMPQKGSVPPPGMRVVVTSKSENYEFKRACEDIVYE